MSTHLPSKSDVATPFLNLSNQMWFTPLTLSFLSSIPGFGGVSAGLGDRAGSQQLDQLWPPSSHWDVPAGNWRVASAGSSWRTNTTAAVSYLEVEELRSQPMRVTHQDERNVFPLLLPSQNPTYGTRRLGKSAVLPSKPLHNS